MVMLSSLWWLPVGVAAVAAVAVWRGVRTLTAEVAALRHSIARLAEVRPLVAQIREENASLLAPTRNLADLERR